MSLEVKSVTKSFKVEFNSGGEFESNMKWTKVRKPAMLKMQKDELMLLNQQLQWGIDTALYEADRIENEAIREEIRGQYEYFGLLPE